MSTCAVRPSDAIGRHVLSVQAQNCLDHRELPGKWGLPLNSPSLSINWKSNVPLLAIGKPITPFGRVIANIVAGEWQARGLVGELRGQKSMFQRLRTRGKHFLLCVLICH